ncbi:MAG TPA: hypothetical protein VNO30_13835 [Kofleriaceae bacterium]|nr:hypothetical protein [Kofleriaceae bacterium]
MTRLWALWLAGLACCGGSGAAVPVREPAPPPPTPVAPPPRPATLGIAVTEAGVGPINAQTPATVEALRALLPTYDVRPVYAPGLGADSGPGLNVPDIHVFEGGELLFVVVPGERGEVLDIRVASPRVTSERGWRIGATLGDPQGVDGCQCISDGLTCFAKGSHVGIMLDDDCQGRTMSGSDDDFGLYSRLESGDREAMNKLAGRKIRMLVWNPEAFEIE